MIACAIDQRTELTEGSGAASGTGNISGGGFGGTSGGTAATGGNGGTLDAGSDAGAAGAPSGGSPSGGGSGGIIEATVEYVATVADCVGANDAPNPDTCATSYLELHLDVSADFLSGASSLIYLRFEIDNQLAGAKILAVELELGNVNDSSQSGEVHEVADFTRPDLFVQAPPLGPTVAADVGPVSIGQSVLWKLSNVPAANKAFCLGLSTTTTDGIGYATLASGTPPKLRVTFTK